MSEMVRGFQRFPAFKHKVPNTSSAAVQLVSPVWKCHQSSASYSDLHSNIRSSDWDIQPELHPPKPAVCREEEAASGAPLSLRDRQVHRQVVRQTGGLQREGDCFRCSTISERQRWSDRQISCLTVGGHVHHGIWQSSWDHFLYDDGETEDVSWKRTSTDRIPQKLRSCPQQFWKTDRHKDRQTDRQTDRWCLLVNIFVLLAVQTNVQLPV